MSAPDGRGRTARPPVGAYLPLAGMPGSVRWARVVLYVLAVATVVTTLGYLAAVGFSAESVGQAVWGVWPGVAAFVLARRLERPSRWLFRLVVGLGVLYVLLSLAALGSGDPRGLTNLVLPVVLLVLVTRRSAREYLHQVP